MATNTRRISSIRGRVDFVVITIRDDELTAVRRRFSPSIPVLDGRQHYDLFRLQKQDGRTATVAVTRAMDQGHTAALLSTQYAIDDLDPQWIILAGIAGAVPDGEFTLGDVMLANSVHDFSVGAAIEGKSPEFRTGGGSMHRAVEKLVTGLPARRSDLGDWNTEAKIGRTVPHVIIPEDLGDDRYYGSDDDRVSVQKVFKAHFPEAGKLRPPDFCVGAAATSNTLVKDTSLLRVWKASVRHLTHIEMELGGAYYAARRHDPEIPLLSVRGISDVVGFKRGPDWTQFACDSTASFLDALLRIVPNEGFEIRPQSFSATIQSAGIQLPRRIRRFVNLCIGAISDLFVGTTRAFLNARNSAPSIESIVRAFNQSSASLVARAVDPEDRIARKETGELAGRFSSDSGRVLCVLGGPGSGKTALLALLSQEAAAAGIATLALKADLLPQDAPFEEWGRRELGLDFSAFDAIRVVASRGRVLVVVDQLDALSSVVAVSSNLFNLVVDFIRKCAALPNVVVICSCREFDFKHDARFAELDAETVELDPPSWEEIAKHLDRKGVSGSQHWPEEFCRILQTPQHLRVFLDRFAETGRSDFRGSYHLMLDDLWRRNVTSDPEHALLDDLTTYSMDHETLWAPLASFATRMPTINDLKAKGLLDIQGLVVSFRHQTLLEHAKARYFTRTDNSFSDYVRSHEDSLQVRPSVWSVLEYLRSARLEKYRHEIESLFAEPPRLHLRYLLIDFLGQNRGLHPFEHVIMGARLSDPADRVRALLSIVGSPEWFRALFATHLPLVMQGDMRYQWPMISVINVHWREDHDGCLALVRNHWFIDAGKDALTLRVMRQTDVWGNVELDMASALIRRSTDSGERLFWAEQLVYDVSQTRPDAAPRLFVDTVEKLEERNEGHSPLESSQSWYELPEVAEAAPVAFLRTAWLWFVSACEEHHRGAQSSVLNRYAGYSLSLDEDSHRSESPILSAYLAAVEGTANTEPNAFVEITKPTWQSENAVVHRMLIRGFVLVAKSQPAEVLEYLAGDQRRFEVGSYYSENRSDSVTLIAELAPHLGSEEMRVLETLIIEWTMYREDQELEPVQITWNREARLHLLDAIPAASRSAEISRLIETEKADLPGWNRKLPRSRAGFVHETSPLSKSEMADASAERIADVICAAPDIPHGSRERKEVEGGWEEPGGPTAAGRELAQLNKENPEKVAAVILYLVARGQQEAASSAFDGLADSNLTDDRILALARELVRLEPTSAHLRHDIGYMLYRRAKKPHGIPDDLCEVICNWIVESAGSKADAANLDHLGDENSRDDRGSVLWENEGQIGFGAIDYPFWLFLAVTEGYLQRSPPAYVEWLQVVERCIAADLTERTWVRYCSLLTRIRFAGDHKARGVEIVTRLLNQYPGLTRTNDGLRLITNFSDLLTEAQLKGVFEGLRADTTPIVRQAYGELLTVVAFLDDEHPWARTILDAELYAADDAAQLDEEIAAGIAHAAAHLWDEPRVRQHSSRVLSRLIPIANTRIGQAISGVFLARDDFAADEPTDLLLTALAANSGPLEHIPITRLVPHLVPLASHRKQLVLSMCEAILASRNDDNRLFEVGPELVTISMTLQRFNETRGGALAFFEQLLRLGLDAAFAVLQEIDIRPAANFVAAQHPRRRPRRRRRKS
jgi:nucleoside phosphorylase